MVCTLKKQAKLDNQTRGEKELNGEIVQDSGLDKHELPQKHRNELYNNLLRLTLEGKSDVEIAMETGLGSAKEVREKMKHVYRALAYTNGKGTAFLAA